MVSFKVETNRWLAKRNGAAIPFLEMLFGSVVDVELEVTGDPSWRDPKGRVFIGDPQSTATLDFKRAPSFVYNIVLLLQKYQESIPGLEDNEFVAIVEGSAYVVNEDGSNGRPLAPGELLPI